MSDNLEPLSTESYTLADFGTQAWMDRPEYREYQGIGIEHLKRLHEGAQMYVFGDPVFGDHVAFVGTDTKCCFEIWLYEVVSWDCMRAIRTALPSFCVLGRTWEGVTEVQACPADSPYPEDIVAQMQWVIEFVDANGWKCDD